MRFFVSIAVVCFIASVAIGTSQSLNWEVIHKQSAESKGSASQPSIRYGHTCVAHRGQLITSHGYYFDRETSTATWLSDTWTMSMKAPYRWSKLAEGASQDVAHAAYSKGRVPAAPCGRFGHGDALVNDTMYLYGGHDGGMSRHGKQNYEPGFDFDELWAFSIPNRKWALVKPQGGSKAPTPGKRYLLASCVVDNRLFVYGGLAEGQGDVWSFDLATKKWTQLAKDQARSDSSPGRRVGHSITPVDTPGGPKGFVLYGGRWIEGSDTGLATATFFFDLRTNTWRALTVASKEQPKPRKYHAEAHTYVKVPKASLRGVSGEGDAVMVGVIAGGTVTTPGLTCTSDAWAFTLNCDATEISWYPLPELPIPVYDTRAAADNTAVYVYGGHLCSAGQADNPNYPFYYINQVARLELATLASTFTAAGPASACRVNSKDLLRETPHAHGGAEAEL